MAITWRDLAAPNFWGASEMMKNAGQSFQDAVGNLRSELNSRRSMQANNVETMRTNNEQAYLDLVSSFKTPEELAAAEQSGVLKQKLDSFGGVYDAADVRDAFANRLRQTQQDFLTNQEFTDKKTDIANRPLADELRSMIYRGDETGAQKLLMEDPRFAALPNKADFFKEVAAQARLEKEDARRDKEAAMADWRFSQEKTKAGREEAEYQAGEQAQAKATELLGKVATESEGRQAMLEWAAKSGIPARLHGAMADLFKQRYSSAYNLTDEENQALEAMKTNSDRLLSEYDRDNVFGKRFGYTDEKDPQKVTETDVLDALNKYVPTELDTAPVALNNAVQNLETNLLAKFKEANPSAGKGEIEAYQAKLRQLPINAIKLGALSKAAKEEWWLAGDMQLGNGGRDDQALNKVVEEVAQLALDDMNRREVRNAMADFYASEIVAKREAFRKLKQLRTSVTR